jgi:stearoyl-CoA desaturase (delta-9 desaturase)
MTPTAAPPRPSTSEPPAPGASSLGPTAEDTQPTENETLDRFLTGLITVLPFIGLGVVAWQLWNSLLHWSDIAVFGITYALCAVGVTVGFHRHFTHRSFKAKPWVRGALAIFGSAAIEGPIISWVADHRKHHAFSDKEGDPHSPHGHAGPLRGLLHAHVGWLFIHTQRANRERYTPDLLKDPFIAYVDRTFLLWVLAGLAFPFGLGWLIGGSIDTALTGLLWGGLVRMLVLHHVTYSINSLCHFFGRRRFDVDDESRNLAWLSLFSLGESWHHNHHAFPTSAHHGLRWWEIDVSSLVIRGLRRAGLAWDVVEISEERQAKKLVEKDAAAPST